MTVAEENCRAVLLLIQVLVTGLGDSVGLVHRIEGLAFGVNFFLFFSFSFSPDKALVLAYIQFLHVSTKYGNQEFLQALCWQCGFDLCMWNRNVYVQMPAKIAFSTFGKSMLNF